MKLIIFGMKSLIGLTLRKKTGAIAVKSNKFKMNFIKHEKCYAKVMLYMSSLIISFNSMKKHFVENAPTIVK